MSDTPLSSNLDDIVKYPRGTVIMAEGESTNYLFLVKKGIIRTFKKEGHRLTAVGIVRSKGFVGELSIFSGEESGMSAIAVEDCEVYMIKKSEISKVLGDCPDWVTNIMETISGRLKMSMDMLLEHKIIDDLYEQNLELTIEEEKKYLKLVDDYCDRRGLNI